MTSPGYALISRAVPGGFFSGSFRGFILTVCKASYCQSESRCIVSRRVFVLPDGGSSQVFLYVLSDGEEEGLLLFRQGRVDLEQSADFFPGCLV